MRFLSLKVERKEGRRKEAEKEQHKNGEEGFGEG